MCTQNVFQLYACLCTHVLFSCYNKNIKFQSAILYKSIQESKWFLTKLIPSYDRIKKLGKTTYTKFIRVENNLMEFTISSRDQISRGYLESSGFANPSLLGALSTSGTWGHRISVGLSFPKQQRDFRLWCQGWMPSWLWWDGGHVEPHGCFLVKGPPVFVTQYGLRWESQGWLGCIFLLIPANVIHGRVPSSFQVLSKVPKASSQF